MGLDVTSGITGAIGTFIGFAQGAILAFNELKSRYESAVECLDNYKKFLDFTNGSASKRREELAEKDPQSFDDMIDSQFGVYFQQSEQAQAFIDDADKQIAAIDNILLQRSIDPSLEPDEELATTESVFRLDNGPPKSISGKFVLSVDGLYYDSQTSGIEPALLELSQRDDSLQGTSAAPNGDLWKLEFDPSLGGRGRPTTVDDLRFYFDNILDPNIIDDSIGIQSYYQGDELLLNLEGQKDRKVFDVSGELADLIAAGASQAVIDNARQVLLSQTSSFQDKINKRKKQIELAVKIPNFVPNAPLFNPGEIPVNDFSYLAGANFLVDIDAQREIVLDQDDVTGVVLPLEVKFTEKITTSDPLVLEHIYLANIAKGEVINNVSSTSAGPSLQINTRIVEDNLQILYNYLTADFSNPSDGKRFFNLRNSSIHQEKANGQIVGSTSSVFDKGLGIAKLDGICKLDTTNNSVLSAVGSYVKLPEVSGAQDIFYNSLGSTFETWINVPALTQLSGYQVGSADTSALYRLVLANENTGINTIVQPQPNLENLDKDGGSNVVRGVVYGFTRDRRFTLNEPASNNPSDNPINDLSLVLAPTQSNSSSTAGFIANRGNDCDKDSLRGLVIPVSSVINGVSLSSCESEFCQLSLTLNPAKNFVKVYLDGVLIKTQQYSEVFGTTREGEVYRAPSIFLDNSFEYTKSRIDVDSISDLKAGPALDTFFTPWIIGGGYTDGNPSGNFMGGSFGGKVSGLRGYVGCTRIYSKALSDAEVLNNYKATEKFFKNIDLS